MGKEVKVWDSPGDAGVGTRGVALVSRDEDIPPNRPDSPGGNHQQPEPEGLQCPCGDYHDDDGDFFEDGNDHVDDGSIYSPGTREANRRGLEALEALASVGIVQEPLTFRERDYPDFEETCLQCGINTLDHTDFIMPCSPEALRQSYMQQYLTITPSGWMAIEGPDGIIITADGREEYYVLCNSKRQERPAMGQRWSWTCYRVGDGGDPCDDDFMRSIST